MVPNILREVEKEILEKNKEISKGEKKKEIKLSDYQRDKIRSLERILENLEDASKRFSGLLKEVENELDLMDIDFKDIKEDIDRYTDSILRF